MAQLADRAGGPLLLQQFEIDALYDTLQVVAQAFTQLKIEFVLIAGSCLGASRSRSILFCDDDIDIAIWASDRQRVCNELPAVLQQIDPNFIFIQRPWPVADRFRNKKCSQVWIDLFEIQKYDTFEQFQSVISLKDNGQPQPALYIDSINSAISNCGAQFPLVHYAQRKAIEMWPREFFHCHELYPFRTDIPFAHLSGFPLPQFPIQYCKRAFGENCLEYFRAATNHDAYNRDFLQRRQRRLDQLQSEPNPSAAQLFITSALKGDLLPLSDVHFQPIQHSRRIKRIDFEWNRSLLADWINFEQSRFLTADTRVALPEAAQFVSPVLAQAAVKIAKPGWFGAAMTAATHSSPTAFEFTSELLKIMEPHVRKARIVRGDGEPTASDMKLSAVQINTIQKQLEIRRYLLDDAAFRSLTRESSMLYNVEQFNLPHTLARGIGLDHADNLTSFHSHSAKISGGKDSLMSRLQQSEHRLEFHQTFDQFVLNVVAPHIESTLASTEAASLDTLYYQAFPCVRVIQPGEFSLGVHCDAAYGFTPSNINIVVPLTPTTRQSGCSALYVESSIGQEDWHSLVPLDQPIDGKAFRFWGSQCLHWTSENNTDVTRVSLDFRIVLGFVWSHLEKSNSLDAYASKPGYYACARRHVLSNGSTQWRNDNPLLPPDVRLGYPFTLK